MKRGRLYHLIFLLISISFLTQPISAQNKKTYAKEITLFENFVKMQMEIDKIPGLSVGFIKDDFIWAKGFGYADLENQTPATEKSAYRLASNTKSMTAVAILQLVERGKIDLDQEVQQYVPYFPEKKYPVTIRQLLGHLGGISHYKNYDVEGHIKEYKDTRESLEIFANFELVAEPGTRYHYSSYGYNLLGAAIESAAKQSYGDFLLQNIWQPLGMTDTAMDDPYTIMPNRVRGYMLIQGEVKNSEFVDISSRFAAGGTRSSVIDLLKYAKGLNEGKVLSNKSLDEMYTSMATKNGYFVDYGMGWHVSPVNGRFHVQHTGGQPETRTHLIQFPQENFYIALAYNLEGGNLHAFSHCLFQLIMNEAWNIDAYTGNKTHDAIFNGINSVFNYGMSYFDRNAKPLTTDQKKLTEAFNYFNHYINPDSLSSNYKKFTQKIENGRHPVADQAFVKIGSYMAEKLQEKLGQKKIEKYHQMGALAFFEDYFKISDIHEQFQISEQVQKTITEWSQDWKKTWNKYTRSLSISPFLDLDQIGKRLKKTFSGSKIYPDFSQDFARITQFFYLNNEIESAIKIGKMAVDLYPASIICYAALANAYVCSGKKEDAFKIYKKAIEINPEDRSIRARALVQYARELINYNQLDEAEAILELAIEIYPNEPRFYNSMAEIYLLRGRGYFRKALEIDPTYEPARNRLKEIWQFSKNSVH